MSEPSPRRGRRWRWQGEALLPGGDVLLVVRLPEAVAGEVRALAGALTPPAALREYVQGVLDEHPNWLTDRAPQALIAGERKSFP